MTHTYRENHSCALCHEYRERPVSFCTGCGQLLCASCFTEHAKAHYAAMNTVSGEVISGEAFTRHIPAKAETGPTDTQLKFAFLVED